MDTVVGMALGSMLSQRAVTGRTPTRRMSARASPVWRPAGDFLAGVVARVAVREFGAPTRLTRGDRALLATAVAGPIGGAAWAPDQLWRVGAVGALALAAVSLLSTDTEQGLHRLSMSLLGLVWLGTLVALAPLGTVALALFAAVSVADVVAFFAGQQLGGPRLSALSPTKRWSGTLCGAAAGPAALVLLSAWSRPTAVAVGGPTGDLVKSPVKRGAGARDSGRWLAGSGGLLDRIESLIGALTIVAVLG
ncbi:phosphatidate cytidylyltransferase [Streptomyces clavifer]|uniref:phosphatidate cytidylyltransferase n=1 Tax=Streptomyces clavifer TaxID=68188 RepID=UPI0033B26DE4